MADRSTRHAIVERAFNALREIRMGSLSKADLLRLNRIERALHALDEEQAEYRERLETAGLLTEDDIDD